MLTELWAMRSFSLSRWPLMTNLALSRIKPSAADQISKNDLPGLTVQSFGISSLTITLRAPPCKTPLILSFMDCIISGDFPIELFERMISVIYISARSSPGFWIQTAFFHIGHKRFLTMFVVPFAASQARDRMSLISRLLHWALRRFCFQIELDD